MYDDRERSKVPAVTFRSGALDVEGGGGITRCLGQIRHRSGGREEGRRVARCHIDLVWEGSRCPHYQRLVRVLNLLHQAPIRGLVWRSTVRPNARSIWRTDALRNPRTYMACYDLLTLSEGSPHIISHRLPQRR